MLRSFYGFIVLWLLGSMAGEFAWAGKYNPTKSIGEAAPEWRELPGIDGQSHSLADFQSYPVLVIAFTCNTCPTAVDYEDRLMALTKQYADGGKCAVIALNANQVADDQLPKMKQRAMEKRFNFVYLRDETQQVAKAYGATVTPEFFVLDKQRRIVYMGALDDSTQPAEVKTRYVEEAIAATLAGQKVTTAETAPRGCLVRYARERRKKAN
jgi:peroxiredoxin